MLLERKWHEESHVKKEPRPKVLSRRHKAACLQCGGSSKEHEEGVVCM